MKLLIVLSVCLAVTTAEKYGVKSSQRDTNTDVSHEQEPFMQDCSNPSIDYGTGDKFKCLCQNEPYKSQTLKSCKKNLRELEQNNMVKICRESAQFYFASNFKCRSEEQPAQTDDSTGKAMQFALDLFRTADPHIPNENFIVSPLSPQVLLSQLLEGCSESARNEIMKAIKLNSRETASLVKALMTAANKDSSANKLDIASAFFRSNNMNLTESFNSARKGSKTELIPVDFSNTREAADTVNQWASRNTRGNIPEVVTEQNLSPDMSMLLLNAIYFKGTWQYKFNQSQTERRATFETAENQKMSVHMMYQTNRLRFGEINYGEYSDSEEGLRWVELPYDGDQLSMIFLLPKTRHQLDKMLSKVNGGHLMEIFKVIKRDYNPIKIHLKVPKFTIKNSVSLVEPLKKLGVKEIFEKEDALKNLTTTPARVGDVKQDAFLSVDEAGTVATAVTKITIIPLSLNSYEDIDFTCDEPFMVMVVDKTSKIPLFMAKIKQPFKTKPGDNQSKAKKPHRSG